MPMRPLTHRERLEASRRLASSNDVYMRGNGKTTARAIRSTSRWTKVSKRKRARDPFCEDPYKYHYDDGIARIADGVHHILPVEEAPHLAFDETNLMSLCSVCHAKMENDEKRKQ